MPPLLAALTLLLALGVAAGAASPPHSEGPPLPARREVARTAVETYNSQQGSGTSAVFRLLKIRSTQRTRFGWGVHFSMNFTIKETTCRKTSSYRIGSCKYKPRGLVKDCSAEVLIINLVDYTPLTSVQCEQHGSSPSSMNAHAEMASPRIHVEHYFPSSYSTAALTAIEGE